jgi:cation diffusion facilitator family transporter
MDFNVLADDAEDPRHTSADWAQAASRSTWVSVGMNVVLSTTQIAVDILSQSQGFIADGIHSLSDLIADFVGPVVNHYSQKEADEEHPYGHQRFETAASLVLGVLLLVVDVGILWSAFHKLEDPGSVQRVHVAAL